MNRFYRVIKSTLQGLVFAFGLLLSLNVLAQSNAGRQIFIPVGVGDITTFIPLLPAPGNATATTVNQSVGGNTYKLKWQEVSDIAYYQINIIDDQGKTHTRQTTELNYELGALPVGTSRVSVLACNLEDQCGAGAYLGTFTATESVIYSIADSLGSPILELDQAGNVLSEMHYKPYGETKEEKKEGIGYTGHLEDTDLGLTYMQARYYDPVLGRFYSDDPVGFAEHAERGNLVYGFNRYAYANNNPYKYTDPDGEFLFVLPAIPIIIEAAIGAATVAVVGTAVVTSVTNDSLDANNNLIFNESDDSTSPEVDPGDVAGKTPEEIEGIAKNKGLEAKGPDPKSGKGAYVDPVTGKQRILVHPDADCGPHCHVNDPEGNRLDENGNKVPPESPEAHLPLG